MTESTSAASDHPYAVEKIALGSRTVLVVSFRPGEMVRGNDLLGILSELSFSEPRCLIDLAGVEKIDGPFFGRLLQVMKAVKQAGGELRMCRLAAPLVQVLKITKMDRLIEVSPERESALAALAGGDSAEGTSTGNATGPATNGN